MWQYMIELAPNAGSGRNLANSTSRTWSFHAQYEFAADVSMTLSLPWSSFEHMVGNWLVSQTDPLWPCRLEELLERFLPVTPEIHRLRLPVTTVGELRSVLKAARAALESQGVREFEGEGVLTVHLARPE